MKLPVNMRTFLSYKFLSQLSSVDIKLPLIKELYNDATSAIDKKKLKNAMNEDQTYWPE